MKKMGLLVNLWGLFSLKNLMIGDSKFLMIQSIPEAESLFNRAWHAGNESPP